MPTITCLILSLFISLTAAQGPSPDMIGGETARSHVKFMASVRVDDAHICGGVVLDNLNVLTAASCVKGKKASDIIVRVGDLEHGRGRSYYVRNITTHELYSSCNSTHDLAILKIQGYIFFDPNTRDVKIARTETASYESVTAYGWGRDKTSVVVNRLRELEMMTVPNDACKQAMKWADVHIMNSHLCAYAYAEKGLCNGDEGGAVVNNANQLVGIITAHRGECANGYPDVFMNTYLYVNWIERTKQKPI